MRQLVARNLIFSCVVFFLEGLSATTLLDTHHLAYDEAGKLVFVEVGQKTRRAKAATKARGGAGAAAELFGTFVNFDAASFDAAEGLTVTFDKVDHQLRVSKGVSVGPEAISWGQYWDDIDKTGWSQLSAHIGPQQTVSNDVKMYSAGYIEGLLTAVRMSQFYANQHDLLLKSEATKHSLQSIKMVFDGEIADLKFKSNLVPHIMSTEPADPYWKHVRFGLFQMWGILDGYNHLATTFKIHTLSLLDMVLLNSDSEMAELMDQYNPVAVAQRTSYLAFNSFLQKKMHSDKVLMAALKEHKRAHLRRHLGQMKSTVSDTTSGKNKERRNIFRMTKQQVLGDEGTNVDEQESSQSSPYDDAHWEKLVSTHGHCTAYVKLLEDGSDIFVGHTTWNDYTNMLRIMKYYDFPLGTETSTGASIIGFSSYPGTISSTDNFYVTSNKLVITDTSIANMNLGLYNQINVMPHVPSFIHLMAVNRMAKSGGHWGQLWNQLNAGDDNAQWIIVDYNLFPGKQELTPNTMWVVESVPGSFESQDMTDYLQEHKYWVSMNRPFFKSIRDVTGHTAAESVNVGLYNYDKNPRASILEGSNPGSLVEMRGLMQRNLYPFAGVLPNNPAHEISARNDLNPSNKFPNGGIDSKIVNKCLLAGMQIQGISGPTHQTTPVFEWEDQSDAENAKELFPGFPHRGQPNKWKFDWQQFSLAGSVKLEDLPC